MLKLGIACELLAVAIAIQFASSLSGLGVFGVTTLGIAGLMLVLIGLLKLEN